MAEGQLRVNGRRITVAGANRHEHDDKGGKVVPLESMVHDAVLMKRYNFNAVRTSHYPNHPFFYEARYPREGLPHVGRRVCVGGLLRGLILAAISGVATSRMYLRVMAKGAWVGVKRVHLAILLALVFLLESNLLRRNHWPERYKLIRHHAGILHFDRPY